MKSKMRQKYLPQTSMTTTISTTSSTANVLQPKCLLMETSLPCHINNNNNNNNNNPATLTFTKYQSSIKYNQQCSLIYSLKFPLLLMLLSLISLLTIVIYYNSTATINYKYSIAIDSGSTHSRLILFRWKANKLNNTGVIEQLYSKKIDTAISTTNNDSEINRITNELIDCIRDITEQYLPENVKNENILIYLGATAGMRLLNQTKPLLAKKILDKIHKKFDDHNLNIKRISIISGKDEGLFAWIAANYLSGKLFMQSPPSPSPSSSATTALQLINDDRQNDGKSFSVLDMGGASAQIARSIDHIPTIIHDDHNDYQSINLFGNDYRIQTFSNLCFGVEQALFRYLRLLISKYSQFNPNNINDNNQTVIEVPCFPKGFETMLKNYPIFDNICTQMKNTSTNNSDLINNVNNYKLRGTGNVDQCQNEVETLVNIEKCQENFNICFKEITQQLHDDDYDRNQLELYYAMSAYYHETKVLKFSKFENITRQQYLQEYRRICMKNFDEISDELKIDTKFTSIMCFRLPYIISTLTNVYKFTNQTWKQLKFTNDINKSYLGWITGMMINETNHIPSESAHKYQIEMEIYLMIILIFIFLFITSIIFIVFKQSKHKSFNQYNNHVIGRSQNNII